MLQYILISLLVLLLIAAGITIKELQKKVLDRDIKIQEMMDEWTSYERFMDNTISTMTMDHKTALEAMSYTVRLSQEERDAAHRNLQMLVDHYEKKVST